jgi:hypothetical protein
MNTAHLVAALGSSFATPTHRPLGDRVKFRGDMWPKLGLPLPWGPRPGSTDNIAVVDSLEIYDPDVRALIVDTYRQRGYTHVPQGPCIDPGYHGQLPPSDFRRNFDAYLDRAQQWRDAGVEGVHFLRPDEGVAGLAWTVDDLNRELRPLFEGPRAQDLMGIVCLGWEPGPRYHYDNAWWVAMCQWMADTFPSALRCVHFVPDLDAPAGGDDDKKGLTNGQAWANVAPWLHVFLVQNAGYTDSANAWPSGEFVQNFSNQFNPHVGGSFPDRFRSGNRFGWPGFSAWGPDQGLIALPAEYAAYGKYWKNFPDAAARFLGKAAMEAGAIGFFDGGFVG